MKNIVVFTTLAVTASVGMAQEMGRVLSSTPVIQQVGVPRQVCSTEQVIGPPPSSGAGATIGAIAGGVLGNTVGHGGGRAVATVIGAVTGAVVGNRLESGGAPQVQQVQQCGTQTFYENRTVAYQVIYEYAGKQYSVQMPQDPGPFVKLQITPVGSATPPPPAAGQYRQIAPTPQVYIEPTYVESPQVVYTSGYYARPYYAQPYYAPIGLSLNFGFGRGYGGGRGYYGGGYGYGGGHGGGGHR